MKVNRRQFLKKAALGAFTIPFLKMGDVDTALKKIEPHKPETRVPLNKDNIAEVISSNAKYALDDHGRWLVLPSWMCELLKEDHEH